MPDSRKKRRSMSKALLASVRKYGRAILCNLDISLKTSRLYSSTHQHVVESLQALDEYIQSFIRLEGKCQVSRLDECLYLNDVRIKVDFGSFESFRHVVDLLKQRGIGEVTFLPGLARAELESLVQLFKSSPPPADSPWPAFQTALSKCSIPHILISQTRRGQGLESELAGGARRQAMGVYFKTMQAVSESMQESKAGKHVNLRLFKRAIHAIVDTALSEEHTLLSLVNVKENQGEDSNHAVNVAVLSVALGAKLGLPRRLLGELGMAALLHDLGKNDLPESVRCRARTGLSPEDITHYHAHVYYGVEKLLKDRMVDSVMKSVSVMFLHHYRYDGTGFPKLVMPKKQNLFTRIVAVANYYDNATTPGCLEQSAQTPEAALRTLMARSGTEFEPLVVKAFVNLMGLYPVGCMVLLDTGEVCTVVAPARDPKFLDRPMVKVVASKSSLVNRLLNLLERDEKNGRFVHSIVKLYQREEVKLELQEYLSVI